jgi:hypothetical protein
MNSQTDACELKKEGNVCMAHSLKPIESFVGKTLVGPHHSPGKKRTKRMI